jgi:hypothetical protein
MSLSSFPSRLPAFLLGACFCVGTASGTVLSADRTASKGLLLERDITLQEAERSKPDKNTPQPAKWKIILTGSGGDLGTAVESYEISVAGVLQSGTFSQTPKTGKTQKKVVKLPEAAVAKLWTVVKDLDAMNLPDFKGKKGKDSPTYTIKLEVAGKTHVIRVEGYSQSEEHLKLILAIQKCYTEGVPQ